ncbi:MAG: oligosaccharide repeat unit polymerase [Lachnospiraceae bacterium]|nr:oligosaccharide repeat unit polymerase [Lachnospiraceae bacterium]
MKITGIRLQYITILPTFFVSMGLNFAGYYTLSGIILMAEAIFLYILCYQASGSLVNLKGLFTISWVGGIGIACLRLSYLQRQWEVLTWICFFLAYLCFVLAYDIFTWKKGQAVKLELEKNDEKARKVFRMIRFITIISLLTFAFTAIVRGWVPLFSYKPHGYSTFSLSGVHYFVISCILVPALTVIFIKLNKNWSKKIFVWLVFSNAVAVIVPIVLVSRFQLLFGVGLGVILYLSLYHKLTWKMILLFFLVLIPVYVLVTMARRHDVAYLNYIFMMRNEQIPIFITQPYIYVANNFENFNLMVRYLTEHSYGLRMLFPVIALTGMKFVFPQLMNQYLWFTRIELTTLTVFYDAYYDFGVFGIVLVGLVIGLASAVITRWIRNNKSPIAYFLHGQMAIYLGLAFFSTWFSNPTTWFFFGLTTFMFIYIEYPYVKALLQKVKGGKNA